MAFSYFKITSNTRDIKFHESHGIAQILGDTVAFSYMKITFDTRDIKFHESHGIAQILGYTVASLYFKIKSNTRDSSNFMKATVSPRIWAIPWLFHILRSHPTLATHQIS